MQFTHLIADLMVCITFYLLLTQVAQLDFYEGILFCTPFKYENYSNPNESVIDE